MIRWNNFFENNKGLFNNNIVNQNNSVFGNQQTNSLFGNDSSLTTTNLFDNNNNKNESNNSLFGNTLNTKLQFNDRDNKKISFFNNHSHNNYKQFDYSLGHYFYGTKIQDNKLMTISSKTGYEHASQEELRLADYEKFHTGKVDKFKILNAKNNELKPFNENTMNNQGLIKNDSNKEKSLFGNNNIDFTLTNNKNSLFNFNEQKNSLFGNNDNNFNGGLFNQINNNKSNEIKSLFGNNDNDNNKTSSQFLNINNNQKESIFGNNKFNQNSLFNDNNNFTSFFNTNKNDTAGKSLFFNKENNNSLFGSNNKTSLFGNNLGNFTFGITNTKKEEKSLFLNNNMNNTPKENPFENNNNKTLNLFDNDKIQLNNNNKNSLFGINEANNNKFSFSLFENKININKEGQSTDANNFSNHLFSKINNTSTNSLYQDMNNTNTPNQGIATINSQVNNNMSQNTNNNVLNNNQSLVLNNFENNLEYPSTPNLMKLSQEDETLSNTITETISKQKSIEQFLEDLEQKYENKENIIDNNDILDNYGTYLENSSNFNKYENEKNLINEIDKSFKSKYQNNMIYNVEEISKLSSKVKMIYGEYQSSKNKYINNYKKNDLKQNTDKKINSNYIYSQNFNKIDNRNIFLGRNNALFQKNLIEIDKLSNSTITTDTENNKEKRETITNNNIRKPEKEYVNPPNNNLQKNYDIAITYNLPKKENQDSLDKNENKLIFKNVPPLKKIKSLIEEIKSQILEELKNKNLETSYSIEKISLLMQDDLLSEANSIQDYDLSNNNFTLQALITYSSISIKNTINEKEEELVPLELVPILTKEGYKCNPSITELSRKSKEELTKIEGFKIYNKYGEVEFQEPINLLGINLDEEITIEDGLIDTSDKLDYNSKFMLSNFKIEESELKKYIVNIEKIGGNFVEYKNNEIVWEYKKKDRI